MEIFNNIIIKILAGLISLSFLIYFIQLFDGFHRLTEFFRSLISGKNSVSVDELVEEDNIRKMKEELKEKHTDDENDDPLKPS